MRSEEMAVPQARTRAERVRAVVGWLRPKSAPVASQAEFSHWICARGANTDEAADWCSTCAREEVARLGALHPDHDYYVAGGYGTDADVPPACCKCGKTLIGHLTRYAIEMELVHYARHGVGLRGGQGAERAFRFIEVFESRCFDVMDPAAWRFFRKVERMFRRQKQRASDTCACPELSGKAASRHHSQRR